MEIFIRTPTGKNVSLAKTASSHTARHLKMRIQKAGDIENLFNVKLFFSGHELDDSESVEAVGVQAESTVHVVVDKSMTMSQSGLSCSGNSVINCLIHATEIF